jgi:catechol 2,3-dioxygenase-like lactoylglutathione lyase family enzyme
VTNALDVIGVDHVQLAIPEGGEELARAFYGGVLGLREVPKPPELATRGGCWFIGTGVALHLGVERPFVAASKAHPAFVVSDLAAARTALQRAGVVVTDDAAGLPVERCYVQDPFGNRIELVDARDAGFGRGATVS